MKKKRIVSLSLIVALLAIIAGGTYAYFTDSKEEVNEFTVGNIKIELNEPNFDKHHLIPGKTIKKDPTVTIKAGSEDSYVFMYLENGLNYFLEDLEIGENWELVEEQNPIIEMRGNRQVGEFVTKKLYVYKDYPVEKSTEDRVLEPLFSNILVKGEELDNEDFEQLYEDGNITIGAFAHQAEGLDYETALAAAIKHFEMTDLK